MSLDILEKMHSLLWEQHVAETDFHQHNIGRSYQQGLTLAGRACEAYHKLGMAEKEMLSFEKKLAVAQSQLKQITKGIKMVEEQEEGRSCYLGDLRGNFFLNHFSKMGDRSRAELDGMDQHDQIKVFQKETSQFQVDVLWDAMKNGYQMKNSVDAIHEILFAMNKDARNEAEKRASIEACIAEETVEEATAQFMQMCPKALGAALAAMPTKDRELEIKAMTYEIKGAELVAKLATCSDRLGTLNKITDCEKAAILKAMSLHDLSQLQPKEHANMLQTLAIEKQPAMLELYAQKLDSVPVQFRALHPSIFSNDDFSKPGQSRVSKIVAHLPAEGRLAHCKQRQKQFDEEIKMKELQEQLHDHCPDYSIQLPDTIEGLELLRWDPRFQELKKNLKDKGKQNLKDKDPDKHLASDASEALDKDLALLAQIIESKKILPRPRSRAQDQRIDACTDRVAQLRTLFVNVQAAAFAGMTKKERRRQYTNTKYKLDDNFRASLLARALKEMSPKERAEELGYLCSPKMPQPAGIEAAAIAVTRVAQLIVELDQQSHPNRPRPTGSLAEDDGGQQSKQLEVQNQVASLWFHLEGNKDFEATAIKGAILAQLQESMLPAGMNQTALKDAKEKLETALRDTKEKLEEDERSKLDRLINLEPKARATKIAEMTAFDRKVVLQKIRQQQTAGFEQTNIYEETVEQLQQTEFQHNSIKYMIVLAQWMHKGEAWSEKASELLGMMPEECAKRLSMMSHEEQHALLSQMSHYEKKQVLAALPADHLGGRLQHMSHKGLGDAASVKVHKQSLKHGEATGKRRDDDDTSAGNQNSFPVSSLKKYLVKVTD